MNKTKKKNLSTTIIVFDAEEEHARDGLGAASPLALNASSAWDAAGGAWAPLRPHLPKNHSIRRTEPSILTGRSWRVARRGARPSRGASDNFSRLCFQLVSVWFLNSVKTWLDFWDVCCSKMYVYYEFNCQVGFILRGGVIRIQIRRYNLKV